MADAAQVLPVRIHQTSNRIVLSHYFEARPADQFDAVVHIDETRAVVPLERMAGWDAGELPETYPWAV